MYSQQTKRKLSDLLISLECDKLEKLRNILIKEEIKNKPIVSLFFEICTFLEDYSSTALIALSDEYYFPKAYTVRSALEEMNLCLTSGQFPAIQYLSIEMGIRNLVWPDTCRTQEQSDTRTRLLEKLKELYDSKQKENLS